jgi:fluoride exporter
VPRRHAPARWVLPAIAVGGMLGASARYAVDRAWPTGSDTLPWSTLVVNVSGCALIGLLMVHVTEVGGAHPLLRPFLGVGVLGGYTTFSTYTVQTDALLRNGHPELALVYLVGTAVSALLAVSLGVVVARASVRARRWWARPRPGREGVR